MKGLFSERQGYKVVKAIQFECMDRDLKVGLWNDLYVSFFEEMDGYYHTVSRRYTNPLMFALWDKFLNRELDQIPDTGSQFVREVKQRYTSLDWKGVYDLVEAMMRLSHNSETNAKYLSRCNETLEAQSAGYRLINGTVTPIINKEGVNSIENALDVAPSEVCKHITRAIELLSDRKEPDYHNSIKESISAVELLTKQMAGDSNLRFAEALNKLKDGKSIGLNPALAESFKNLYGMASNVPGIRHGKPGESSVKREDAIHMLVTCSAIVNLLTAKADNAGIDLRR